MSRLSVRQRIAAAALVFVALVFCVLDLAGAPLAGAHGGVRGAFGSLYRGTDTVLGPVRRAVSGGGDADADLQRQNADLQRQNAALRQQLAVFKRNIPRPKVNNRDRLFWIGLYMIWQGWQSELIFVRPETVTAWHHNRFKRYWWKLSQSKQPGRPRTGADIRKLIHTMATANPTW